MNMFNYKTDKGMKRVLLFAVPLLGISLLFNACKPETNGAQTVTGVTITPAELTIGDYEEPVRLSYTFTPEGAKAELEWTSSNEDVATVSDRGVVTPLQIGEATITAKVKDTDITGACKVNVVSITDKISFRECLLTFNDYDSVNTVVLESNTYGNIKVHIAQGRLQIFTDGFYFNESGSLDGTEIGGYIYIQSPIALGMPEDNKDNAQFCQDFPNGVTFSLGSYYVDKTTYDSTSTDWHHAQVGTANENVFFGYLNQWLDSYNTEGKFTQDNYTYFAYAQIYGFTGTDLVLKQYEVDDEGNGSYGGYPNWLWEYMPSAIVTSGEIYVSNQRGQSENSSKYMTTIDYMNLTVKYIDTDEYGVPGVYCSADSVNNKLVITSKNIEYGAEKTYTIGTKPENMAPAANGVNIFIEGIIPSAKELGLDNQQAISPKATNLTVKK